MNTSRVLGALMAVACVFGVTTAHAGAVGPDSGGAPGSIPNVALITHENTPVRFHDDLVKGKVVVINFMFTSCDAYCPLTTANLVRVQAALGDRLGRDIFLYSITLDPEHDTPAVLKQYREGIGARPGWVFLTGTPETIERLRRKLGVYDLDPAIDADKTKHSGVVVYGNDAKDRWAAMPGLAKPDFIARSVLRVAPPEIGR
jgi:protein SCO1